MERQSHTNQTEAELESVETPPRARRERADAHRRQVLGLSLVGGWAALLAACGKFVTKYDKMGAVDGRIKGQGEAEGTIPTEGGGGGGGADPSNPGSDPTPTPTATPAPNTPSTGGPIKVDTSTVTPKNKDNVFNPSGKDKDGNGGNTELKFYGSRDSAMLAMKLKKTASSDQDVVAAVGDLVTILTKKAGGTYLLAARRIQSSDEYRDSFGLVMDSLCLRDATGIVILLAKGNALYKVEFEGISFRDTISAGGANKTVYDLGLLRRNFDTLSNFQVFDLISGFGTNAPSMLGTSLISGTTMDLGLMKNGGTRYIAATATSTWSNVSALVSPAKPSTEDVIVQNIFGDVIPSGEYSTMFRTDLNVVVYVSRNSQSYYYRYTVAVG